jgi:RimJ/RimL family protein N-acetyltransferase/nitroimidazol reductase NimA-like FMN-containing flavoprotein (pyridoxamine 5'-phosphate oxidase superfamily)
MTYPATPLTTPSRYPDRATYDKDAVHELLDEQFFCHVGFVVDGASRVLPTLFVRVGEAVYLHGSTAATWLLAARRDSLPVVVSIAAMDALVLARAQPHHSANYRSVVVHGDATLVTDEADKRAAMAALIEKVGPGRTAETRPPTAAELAATAVLRLDLESVSMKRRAGGPKDDEADLALPHWAGVIPLAVTRGPAAAEPAVSVPAPAYVPIRSRWFDAPTLIGKHIRLERTAIADAEEMFYALDDDEVWAFTTLPRPGSPAEMTALLTRELANPARMSFTKRLAATGEIVGTSSFYDINPDYGSIAIGYTQIAKPWWRTAVNTESKLLMLRHAFDDLGAERVVWHADIRNSRSQTAIIRLGAAREGVLRHQRRRRDGSWRDTAQFSMISEEWPAARQRLMAWAER